MADKKTLVIRNGTLIDGSGQAAARNDAIVIEGNRIKSVGALPPDVRVEDRSKVEVLDAGGQWIMPGLIDAHCHMSYGYPGDQGRGQRQGHDAAGILHAQVGAQRAEGAARGRHQHLGAGRHLVHRCRRA